MVMEVIHKMRISFAAQELSSLKYKERAQEIDKRHKQKMARISLANARRHELHQLIVQEYLAMATEKAEAWAAIRLEAFIDENLLPDPSELISMGNSIQKIVEQNIPPDPYAPGPHLMEHFTSIPIRIYASLEDKVRRLELEKQLNEKRLERIVAAVRESSNTDKESSVFSFIANSRIRTIVERDYAELEHLDPNTSPKSVLILSGGIIEGLLIDALVKGGYWTEKEANERFLKDMIHPAKNKGIIKHDNITEVLRVFRNIVHPAREIRDNLTFTADHASHAKTSVNVVIAEVKQWHEENQ
jgi:hypothetical protein